MAEPVLRLENLSKYYTSAQSVVMGLNGVCLSFSRGEFVAITGESGSGKSTLAHVLGGILPYESGEMFFMGKPTSHFDGTDYERYRRDHISFISQSYGILPGCTVMENVVSALRLSGMDKAGAQKKAQDILREVELWELHGRRAAKLSSGQKQRLSIARALAKPAPILIADEPTGNLDPENSAKVINLLSHAAKERLVILITHEFSEVRELATRHIMIQDGQVAMDAQLRPAAEATAAIGHPETKKQMLSFYVSRLQLGGRPVWSAMVLLFFALTAFAVFAFLGTFIIALDDTPTRIYDNSAFRNGNQTRIVAVRSDNASMTWQDYRQIVSCDYVSSVERFGYVADVNYAYREGVDYRWENTAVDKGTWDNPDLSLSTRAYLTGDTVFLQTVPVLGEDQTFLTAGRLPESVNEVVLCGDADRIGTTVAVFLQDMKNWNVSSLISLRVEVVGVTTYGSGLYFHDDIGRAFTNMIHDDGDSIYLPSAELADDQIRCSEYLYSRIITGTYPPRVVCRRRDLDDSADPNDPENYVFLNLIQNDEALSSDDPGWLEPCHSSMLNQYFQVSPATFQIVTRSQASEQVSITIEDYAYTDRVLQQLREKGYVAISPFREGSTEVDEELAAERRQTLAVCVAVLAAVILLQAVVLRALFGTQTESYRLLSNIGLTCPTAKLSILWQVLLFALPGQLLGFGGLLLCKAMQVERVIYVLRYLPAQYMLLLSGVHLAAALVGAVWVLHAVTGQVFPYTGKTGDLPLEEEEAAV